MLLPLKYLKGGKCWDFSVPPKNEHLEAKGNAHKEKNLLDESSRTKLSMEYSEIPQVWRWMGLKDTLPPPPPRWQPLAHLGLYHHSG